MTSTSYLPILELIRGTTRESIHFGAIAVVDSHANLVASYSDPQTTTFLRSTSKPLQALALIEYDGHRHWGLTPKEIAIICASHAGTDAHIATVSGIQARIGITEDDLLCGTHYPLDKPTARAMRSRGEKPTPNHHNCSGKHTGMLALARLLNLPMKDYINPDHPIQKRILQTFSEMCDLESDDVALGTDGCSAPNFAVPMQNAALGLARLCDPHNLPAKRAKACRVITNAIISHPEMISGPGRFDTRLIEVGAGSIIVKGGAEGYMGLGIMPEALASNTPGMGVTIKISDGDAKGRARPAVALEVLRQLGALSSSQLEALSEFGPRHSIKNQREIIVGEMLPIFSLNIR
ncbi:MAG: asparaginase [Chloroflexota bacterium]|nr:asparaginase [Chloroflexota bacterium]